MAKYARLLDLPGVGTRLTCRVSESGRMAPSTVVKEIRVAVTDWSCSGNYERDNGGRGK